MILALGVLVGVLSFTPGDTGLPYAVNPTTSELSSLGDRLAHDLRAGGAPARHLPVTCSDAACARRAGLRYHVARIVFSSATRHMAMIWTAQATVVDVKSGHVTGPYDIGYKGDFDAIRAGLDSLAAALLPAVGHPAATAMH